MQHKHHARPASRDHQHNAVSRSLASQPAQHCCWLGPASTTAQLFSNVSLQGQGQQGGARAGGHPAAGAGGQQIRAAPPGACPGSCRGSRCRSCQAGCRHGLLPAGGSCHAAAPEGCDPCGPPAQSGACLRRGLPAVVSAEQHATVTRWCEQRSKLSTGPGAAAAADGPCCLKRASTAQQAGSCAGACLCLAAPVRRTAPGRLCSHMHDAPQLNQSCCCCRKSSNTGQALCTCSACGVAGSSASDTSASCGLCAASRPTGALTSSPSRSDGEPCLALCFCCASDTA